MIKNKKKVIIDYDNSIKKSNEFSMARMNYGLTLNQMQLLAYAIYCTQQNGKTEFNKSDFEKKFDIEKYQTKHAKEDSKKLYDLSFAIEDIENDYFDYLRVFQRITYDRGLFTFKWSEDMIPHILELKHSYITNGLPVLINFKSGFSWKLYDYLKASYGNWYKTFTKAALMKLFGVEDKVTYKKNTAKFKQTVLDVAIAEINKYTELEVTYQEQKKGRAIIGFQLRWSTGQKLESATNEQINTLKAIINSILSNEVNFKNMKAADYRKRAIYFIEETYKMENKINVWIKESRSIKREILTEQNQYKVLERKEAKKMIEKARFNLEQLNKMLDDDGRKAEEEVLKYDWVNS
ncbi:RepB family plasmid replication initiator protein [Bacilli bacterium]|uniref:replication initiation protein n=1 Tax=Oceanobacillus TaxID=182709 RepID=UPI0006211F81|nr:hypothetical protein WH51_14185 [Bacilli bacterium VT-13-104]PZD83269.1 RepB family plasmid replication initiator protein [Bacilli bacterium]PZD84453.1 RepB family plasmid replication initiator protein [Bacilli bacterium]PZD86679.1 RepB family plasmid replication initiator protein [Bacilli bacterium]RCO04333.1 RepB family plasmid replication initiator protein [Bacilli bacterium]